MKGKGKLEIVGKGGEVGGSIVTSWQWSIKKQEEWKNIGRENAEDKEIFKGKMFVAVVGGETRKRKREANTSPTPLLPQPPKW